jgi:hypothetical protein
VAGREDSLKRGILDDGTTVEELGVENVRSA